MSIKLNSTIFVVFFDKSAFEWKVSKETVKCGYDDSITLTDNYIYHTNTLPDVNFVLSREFYNSRLRSSLRNLSRFGYLNKDDAINQQNMLNCLYFRKIMSQGDIHRIPNEIILQIRDIVKNHIMLDIWDEEHDAQPNP